MKEKIKSHVKVIMLFCMALLMFNCQDEENSLEEPQSKIQTVTIDEAKDFINDSKNNFSAKSANNKFENLEIESISQEKINGSNQLLTVIPFTTNNNRQNDRILLLRINNEIKSIVFSMYPEENSVKGNFSGNLFSYSLDGNFITGFRAKDGIIVSQFVENTATAKSAVQLREVIIQNKTVHALDVFGSSNIFGNDIFGGGNSGSGGGRPSYSWDAGGDSGITAPAPLQIIDALTGKAKCLNDLLNKKGDSFVQKLLANFQGNSKFDISIASKEIITSSKNGVVREVNGRTLPPIGKLINIEISTSKANTNSALDVARTILHEYIHADIFRKLGTNLGTDKESLDFKATYEAYGEQHSTIAILYLNSMKDALKGFHKDVLTDDYNKYTQYFGEVPSDAFYEALAWGGLKDADVKAWTALSPEKKAAIEALANRVPMLSKIVPCSN